MLADTDTGRRHRPTHAQAKFPSKRNRLRCVRCVWMEIGLREVVQLFDDDNDRVHRLSSSVNTDKTPVVKRPPYRFSTAHIFHINSPRSPEPHDSINFSISTTISEAELSPACVTSTYVLQRSLATLGGGGRGVRGVRIPTMTWDTCGIRVNPVSFTGGRGSQGEAVYNAF